MASRNMDMQAIFSELSEQNKDIVILIARSVKVAQEVAEQPRKPPAQALETLGMAKANIERARDWARATVRPEVLDEFGRVINMPQAETEARGESDDNPSRQKIGERG